jgi:hypothetical protein
MAYCRTRQTGLRWEATTVSSADDEHHADPMTADERRPDHPEPDSKVTPEFRSLWPLVLLLLAVWSLIGILTGVF